MTLDQNLPLFSVSFDGVCCRDSAEWAKAVERRDKLVAMDPEAPVASEKKASKRRSSRKKTHTDFNTTG